MATVKRSKVSGITDTQMRSAAPAKGYVTFTDPRTRGGGSFSARILASGAKLFYFGYSHDGKQRVYPIGPYSATGDGLATFSVVQARAKATALSILYRAGITNLHGHFEKAEADKAQAERDATRAAEDKAVADALERERRITVRQLFTRWAETDLAPRVDAEGRRSGRQDGGAWVGASFERRVFPRLGGVPVADVRKADILQILDGVKTEGKVRTTNMLLTDLQQMFAFAHERDIIESNPISGLKKRKVGGADVKRERVLNDGEVRHLAAQLPKARMAPRSMAAVWLIMATAVRVSEAITARWEHVDLEARTLFLPTTKNGRDHTIHLSDFAVKQIQILSAMRGTTTDDKGLQVLSPWLFPNTAGDDHLDVKTLQKQVCDRQRLGENQLNGRTALVDVLCLVGGRWTCHDLRRSAASFMAGLGISKDTIDECLNHRVQDVAGVYIQDRRLPQQKLAFNALGARLATLTSGKSLVTNVRNLKARAA